MSKKINASRAKQIFKESGIEISYPTTLLRLKAWGLYDQPTGKWGAIVIDEADLQKAIKEKYIKGKAGRPRGSKKKP